MGSNLPLLWLTGTVRYHTRIRLRPALVLTCPLPCDGLSNARLSKCMHKALAAVNGFPIRLLAYIPDTSMFVFLNLDTANGYRYPKLRPSLSVRPISRQT